jgi:hypothetical protein
MATAEIGQKLSGILFLWRLFWKGRSLIRREGSYPNCVIVCFSFFQVSLSTDGRWCQVNSSFSLHSVEFALLFNPVP